MTEDSEFEVGDLVEVINNVFDSKYNFLVGKQGTVVDFPNSKEIGVQFDYDEEWAEPIYDCDAVEIILIERGKDAKSS